MAEVAKSKLKLLFLARIFAKETDESHGISVQEIIEKLAEEGIEVERKTVYRDIECLRAFGYDILLDGTHRPAEYRLINRRFQDQELFLMADAVQSSRFLTQKKSASLVKAISELGSRHIADGMHKRVYVEGRIKSLNESVFYNVDAIQRAMDKKRKVSFVYYKYDARGKLVASRDGERYVETPVQLMYTDDEYYLVAWNDKHNSFTNYRADRMKSIEISDEPSTRNEEIASFDVSKYQLRVFGMYSGETANVTLSVEPDAMNTVIDRFGPDANITISGSGQTHISTTVMVAPTFFGWLAILGTKVRIESPKSVQVAYQKYLNEIVASYQEKQPATIPRKKGPN